MISLFKVFMSDEAVERASKTMKSGMITQATEVDLFESKLQTYFDHPYVLTVNSATSGLTLAFKMLKLNQHSDEVLSCPLTCTATNWPILANQYKLKWVDVDPNTGCISVADLRTKISETTKALVLIHWAGIPIDTDAIADVIDEAERKYGFRIKVVEDCAHAFGAEYHNKQKVGVYGMKRLHSISVFSLQAIKHLTTGDGGLVLCPTAELHNYAKKLRWFGIDRNARTSGTDFRMEPDVPEIGYKYHMNDIAASIGLGNLEGAIKNVEAHYQNGQYLQTQLAELSNKYPEMIKPLQIPQGCQPAWWIFTFKIINRDEFIYFCKTKNVMASQVHRRNDFHSCCAEFETHLPALDEYEKEYVSVPCGWWVTQEQLTYITVVIREWLYLNKATFVIRALKPEDYSTNYLRLYKQLNNVDLSSMTEKEFTLKYQRASTYHHHYYVIENVDHPYIVACGKLVIEEKMYDSVAHIQDVITDASYQRKGFGTRLIYHLIKQAKFFGCYKIVLAAQEKNRGFYSALGFQSDNVEWKMFL